MPIKQLIIIAGPTAVGKTDLAIAVAKMLNTEIISFDSRQFFKEIHIGTARPLENEWQNIKHHFLGHISVQNKYSIGDFERAAVEKVNALFLTKDFVVAVGGSGLYINALVNGTDEMPEVDEDLRVQLNSDLNSKGLGYIQELLNQYDPEYYKEVDINNPQRMVRALEVSMGSGVPFSAFRKQSKAERNFFPIKYAIDMPREKLYERINLRVDKMMVDGLLQEVESNLSNKHLNALNTVGYKELFEYLEGKVTLDFAVDKIKQHTRNFAKRQITWFKHQDTYQWLSAEAIADDIKLKYDKN
jgi:tRNA dimethylallyltransferase